MILCHFLGSGVILSFNIFCVNLFIIRKQNGHFVGCDFASLFSFVFENTENATVDLVCATRWRVITIKAVIRFMRKKLLA